MREVVRLTSQGSSSLLDRVVSMEWTAYDEKSFTLPDDVPPDRIKDIRRIRVSIVIHDAEESRDFYINDRIRGIDLDGDPGNGVARAHERTFGITLSNSK